MNETLSGGSTYVWGADSPVERCIRDGNEIVQQLGVNVSPSRVNRLARRWVKQHAFSGPPFAEYFHDQLNAGAEKRRHDRVTTARAISYPDPTGERAANRVDRERRRKELQTAL